MKTRYETTPNNQDLIDAVSKGAEQDLIRIIDTIDPTKIESVIIRLHGQRQQNLLHLAAKNGQLIIFKILLDKIGIPYGYPSGTQLIVDMIHHINNDLILYPTAAYTPPQYMLNNLTISKGCDYSRL